MPRYEFSEGTSNKFWQIDLTGTSFTTTYGKIGAAGQTTLKSFADEAAAKKEYEKLVAEKVKKGYLLVGGGAPAAAPAPAPAAASVKSQAVSPAPAAAPTKVSAPPAPAAPQPAAGADTGKARYEFVEGSSSKFWEISLDGASFTTTYGKIGTSGQTATKDFDEESEAEEAYEKLVAEKVKKGYVLVSGAPVGAPPAFKSNPDLEKAILASPDDAQAYLVYADWLQSQGDPRGELIALQHAKATDPAKRAAASASEKKLFEKHEKELLGPIGKDSERYTDVVWRYGFLKSVRVGVDYDSYEEGSRLEKLLKTLLEHPSARFLDELILGPESFEGEADYQKCVDLLVKLAKPASLRSLFVADFSSEDCEVSWSQLGNASKLYAAFPQLEKLTFHAGSMTLGQIDLPALKEFRVQTGGLSRKSIKDVCSAKWPKLERLEIWFGTHSYGAEGTVKDIEPILAAQGLPNLKHLGLMNAEFTDEICKALAGSKVLAQLETLDLSMGCMTTAGVETLLAAKQAFKHLKRLDVSDNAIAGDAEKKLKGVCAEVVSGGQSPDRVSDDSRYTAVGE